MYDVKEDNGVKTLYRTSKSGKVSTVLQVINTAENRLLVVDKSKIPSLRFKSDTPVKLVNIGNTVTATIKDNLQVFKLPHYIAYHNEVLKSNSAMLHQSTGLVIDKDYIDDIALNYDVLLDNMLEFIAEL